MIWITETNLRKYFPAILILLTIILAIVVIFPFITPVLTSMILAYVFYPVYKLVNKKVKRKNISALLVSLLIVLLLVIPFSFIVYQLSKEVNVGYLLVKQKLAGPGLFEGECGKGFFCSVWSPVKDALSKPEIKFYIEDGLKKLASRIAQNASEFVFSIPSRIIDIFLTFFITFFFLRDGKEIVSAVEKKVPLKKVHKNEIINQIHEVVHAIIYGFFVVAILQGIIGVVTFYIFGVSSPIIWGVVIALLVLVPFIGSSIIWIPAAILKLLDGSIGDVVGITVGGLIMGYIDTFLKPKLIGDKSSVHPAVILIGLLGGLKMMGFVGIIIGPIILSLLILFIKMFVKER